MTQVPLRIWLITSLGLVTGACATAQPSLGIKVYRLRPDGLHRKLEVVPLEKAWGSYVLSPSDMETLVLEGVLDRDDR